MLLTMNDAPCVTAALAVGQKGRRAGIDHGTTRDGCRMARAGAEEVALHVTSGGKSGGTSGQGRQSAQAMRVDQVHHCLAA